MDTNQDQTPTSYATAGVDEQREQDVFARAMRPWLARTSARSSMVTSITGLSSGYFATILQLESGPPLAMSTDGVGTKILLAREANRWEPIGIDCVANNVNDLICVGAVPLALLDYVATDRIDEGVLEEIARGLYLGADLAGIAIPGGEIAQIGSMLADASSGRPMLDLVGTAIGALPAGRVPIDGSGVRSGDVIIGLPSSGLHSNGYSLARHVLFDRAGMKLSDRVRGRRGTWTTRCSSRPGSTWPRSRPCGRPGWSCAGWSTSPAAGYRARLSADVPDELDARCRLRRGVWLIAEAGEVSADDHDATFKTWAPGFHRRPRGPAAGGDGRAEERRRGACRVGWVTGRSGRAVSVPAASIRGRATRSITFKPWMPVPTYIGSPRVHR